MIDLIDLSGNARRLIGMIANRQTQGRISVTLPDLASELGVKLAQLHPVIRELTLAGAVQMERLGCDQAGTAAIVRFHLRTNPTRLVTRPAVANKAA